MRHAWYQQLSGLALEASKAALADSVPALSVDGHSIATFAGGCFWGIELAFQRVPGVVATGTGYTQGHVAEPSYQEVCSGTTGHTEAIQVHFKPNEVSYEDLLKVFWERIDPLMENGQGGDRGKRGHDFCLTQERLVADHRKISGFSPVLGSLLFEIFCHRI